MRVPEGVTRCVCFIGAGSFGSAREHYAGTGFVLAMPKPAYSYLMIDFQCVVTARHVLYDSAHRRYPYTFVTFNGRDGHVRSIAVPGENWIEHESSDVAVLPVEILGGPDLFRQVNYEPFFSQLEDDSPETDVQVGAELLVTGLFLNHPGTERIIPVVRHGHIAAFPEPIKIDFGPGRGDVSGLVLAEMHSLSGLSGSPVFLVKPELIVDAEQGLMVRNFQQQRYGAFWLLGVMHGYFPTDADPDGFPDNANTGIAPVIPTSAILQLIRGDEYAEWRTKYMAENPPKGSPVPGRASPPVARMDERVKIDGDPEDVLRALLASPPVESDEGES